MWYQSRQAASLTLYGNVDIRTVNLSFRVGGRLASLAVDEGDAITAGQVLGEIDKAPYENALMQAKANVSTAKAKYDLVTAGYRDEEFPRRRRRLTRRRRPTITRKTFISASRGYGKAGPFPPTTWKMRVPPATRRKPR
jgi:HlyD family secretion protein